MSWEEEKDRRNKQALTRLTKSLPSIFPPSVLARSLGRPFIPPTPRLAIDSYCRAHPIRADRLARALATRSGAPNGWTWQLGSNRGLPMKFRTPPAPYRERAYTRGAGFCCVCGQPVYRFGWHVDLWNAGPNKNANWHCACVIAWEFWNAPSGEALLLRRLQARRCGQTGRRLWKSAEVGNATECPTAVRWPISGHRITFDNIPLSEANVNWEAHFGQARHSVRPGRLSRPGVSFASRV
jgi:hypothetical protein